MAELAKICGTSKGMIYGHYSSKDELASAAFDYSVSKTWSSVNSLVGVIEDPHGWLHAFIDAWDKLNVRPPMPGGCPIMRIATEAPEVRRTLGGQARQALSEWIGRIKLALNLLRDTGVAREDLDPTAEAEFIFASLEGAGLMARINGSSDCSHRIVTLLHAHIDSLVVAHA
ncbi:hypothetical protein AXA44_34535 [Rhodococcus sp. SC4]|nr:hypothetical protein AXA44_34535 [Rhodococcus sp. SC4]